MHIFFHFRPNSLVIAQDAKLKYPNQNWINIWIKCMASKYSINWWREVFSLIPRQIFQWKLPDHSWTVIPLLCPKKNSIIIKLDNNDIKTEQSIDNDVNETPYISGNEYVCSLLYENVWLKINFMFKSFDYPKRYGQWSENSWNILLRKVQLPSDAPASYWN